MNYYSMTIITVTFITITITSTITAILLVSKVLSLLFSLDFFVNLQSFHGRSSVKSACKNLAMSKRYINKRSRPGVSDTKKQKSLIYLWVSLGPKKWRAFKLEDLWKWFKHDVFFFKDMFVDYASGGDVKTLVYSEQKTLRISTVKGLVEASQMMMFAGGISCHKMSRCGNRGILGSGISY